MSYKRSHNDSGFTLIEMLVALAIFSLLSAGAMMAMFTSMRTKTHMDQSVDRITEIETARALMKSDLSNLILRENRDPYGGQEPYLISGGAETLLSFTRTGRENPGGLEKRGGLQRVAYVFEDNQLIRRSYAVDNPAPQTQLRDRVLIDDLENVRIAFEDNFLRYGLLYVSPADNILKVDMMVLTLTFPDGQDLVQKFEMRP